LSLQLYNTMSGRKEPFEPYEPGHVRMYTCGPTVYDYIHLGNARAFVVPDVIKRYLQWRGYKVTHVQNITDIEDKIIAKAAEEGVPFQVIVDRYTEAYLEDIERLGCQTPTVMPKASEHIPGIIDMIERLIERGHAYAVGANVYFAVESHSDYGALSGQSLDALVAGARVEVDEEKRHPADFALWKAAKPGEPAWDSPWGPGRPGWHIECSVMSTHYLGQPFDIHTGGADLVFPHHENEIAQSEAATGKKFVRYWVHNGYINVDGEKMAKSAGNFFTVRELFKKYSPQVVRLFLVSKHYRSPIEFNEEVMEATERGYNRLVDAAELLRELVPEEYVGELKEPVADEEASRLVQASQDAVDEFVRGMDDDINTAVALAAIYDLTRQVNAAAHRAQAGASQDMLRALGHALHTLEALTGVLGLELARHAPAAEQPAMELVRGLVQLAVDLRSEARRERRFDTADAIRDRLAELGIMLEDTPQGTRWKLSAPDREARND
jgi:cysteinyl-tRNA synthetase